MNKMGHPSSDTNTLTEHFLVRAAFGSALMGMAQRGNLYSGGSSDLSRDAFREALRKALERLTKQYKKKVSSDQHCRNIEKLSDDLSASHKRALKGGRFRIGSAQKALNLYLKFMWCLGRIEQPPHCPFDARVLSKIPHCRDVKWTRLDCINEYRRVVAEAGHKAKTENLSLAEWEMKEYQLTKY
jgi:hypothetical protein